MLGFVHTLQSIPSAPAKVKAEKTKRERKLPVGDGAKLQNMPRETTLILISRLIEELPLQFSRREFLAKLSQIIKKEVELNAGRYTLNAILGLGLFAQEASEVCASRDVFINKAKALKLVDGYEVPLDAVLH